MSPPSTSPHASNTSSKIVDLQLQMAALQSQIDNLLNNNDSSTDNADLSSEVHASVVNDNTATNFNSSSPLPHNNNQPHPPPATPAPNIVDDNPPPSFPSLKISIVDCNLPPTSTNNTFPSSQPQQRPFAINSRKPIPFQTPTFTGHILLVLRNDSDPDPHYHANLFSGKNRTFELQIQGKFTTAPSQNSTLYIGGEITECMKLSLLTRGLCRILLSFCKGLNGGLCFNFGEKGNGVLPNIVFPLWSSVDKMIITPSSSSSSLPQMGLPFNENATSRTSRQSSTSTSPPNGWNTSDTYSYSFNSMYISLEKWKLINLPMMRDVDLSTFWGNAGLRMVVYEHQHGGSRSQSDGKEKGKDKDKGKHYRADNRYVMCLDFKSLSYEEQVANANESLVNEEKMLMKEDKDKSRTMMESKDSLPWGKVKVSMLRQSQDQDMLDGGNSNSNSNSPSEAEDEEEDEDEDDSDDSDDDDEGFFDTHSEVESEPQDAPSTSPSKSIKYKITITPPLPLPPPPSLPLKSTASPSSSSSLAPSSPTLSKPLTPSPPALKFKINNLVPFYIDMINLKLKSKYTRVYAFNVADMSRTVFRTSDEFNRYFPSPSSSNNDKSKSKGSSSSNLGLSMSPRLSSSEVERRNMSITIHTQQKKRHHSSDFQSFTSNVTQSDKSYLRGPKRNAPISTSGTNANGVLLEGAVGRALSETHWIEEWSVLTSKYLSFYHFDNKRPTFRISISEMLSAKIMEEEDKPLMRNFYFLEIETLGRVHYIMVDNEGLLNRWVEYLTNTININTVNATHPVSSSSIGDRLSDKEKSDDKREKKVDNGKVDNGLISSILNININIQGTSGMTDDPSEQFLHKSDVFKCKKRRVMNCRRLIFRDTLSDECGASGGNGNANEIVEVALKKALELQDDFDDSSLLSFLDSAAKLKKVNLQGLNEAHKLAFFLNLYHLMITHSSIILGSPTSSFKWISYFNMIAYQVSDDILSLTELEHCVIRHTMTPPNNLLSKLVLPHSRYTFNMKIKDSRINFALNCGSLSNPSSILIYTPEKLNQQLDLVSSYYLQERCTVQVQGQAISTGTKHSKTQKVVLSLPRICQWYANDFGNGRPIDIAKFTVKFLCDDKKVLLKEALKFIGMTAASSGGRGGSDGGNVNVNANANARTNDDANMNTNKYLNVKYLPYDFTCKGLTVVEEDLLVTLMDL